MKNSASNRFIWAHIFKKAPTSKKLPPASRKRDGRHWCTIFYFQKSGPSLWKSFLRLWSSCMEKPCGRLLRSRWIMMMKHEIQLFKVLLSLKVVKFDKKIHLNFSNFRGRTSAGGPSLGPKTGTSVGWGGLTKFLPDGGDPQSPRKKPCELLAII